MTVCIAAVYGKDQGIIAVADKMFTSAPGILTVHEVNENNKIAKLNKSCIAMMAGNVTNASSIITTLASRISDTDKIEKIASLAGEIYREHYQKALEDGALSRWGLTRDEFIKNQQSLDKDLVRKLNEVISQSSLEVEILIAGCDSTGPNIYFINNPGTVDCLNSTGIGLAGSGAAHASLSMVDSQYQKSDNLGSVLFKTFKAKKRAEYDPNVGKYTSLCLVNATIKEFTDDEIKDLYDAYESSEKKTLEIVNDVTLKLGRKYDGNSGPKKQ